MYENIIQFIVHVCMHKCNLHIYSLWRRYSIYAVANTVTSLNFCICHTHTHTLYLLWTFSSRQSSPENSKLTLTSSTPRDWFSLPWSQPTFSGYGLWGKACKCSLHTATYMYIQHESCRPTQWVLPTPWLCGYLHYEWRLLAFNRITITQPQAICIFYNTNSCCNLSRVQKLH